MNDVDKSALLLAKIVIFVLISTVLGLFSFALWSTFELILSIPLIGILAYLYIKTAIILDKMTIEDLTKDRNVK